MDHQPPPPRYTTRRAIDAIIKKLNWPPLDDWQDWPLEVSNKISMDQCLQEYPKLTDEDEQFLVMRAILYKLDETKSNFQKYSAPVVKLLKADFAIHSHTIYYWSCYEDEPDNLEDAFQITPLMRQVWDSRFQ